MELKQIETLAKQKRYQEALSGCERLLREAPEKKADILRTRAHVFARSGDYQHAVVDWKAIIEMGEATIRDYYRGADNALFAGQFAQAASWFQEVLRLGEEQNEDWFKSASYFLLAYAQMELKQYTEALASLNKAIAIEADVSMPLPDMCGMCNSQQLREEIERRKAIAK
jgi:tetratricopeptide (TPR) repeat protein